MIIIPKAITLANNIKNIRLTLDETMEEFGKHFNPEAHKSLVSKWEKAQSQPNIKRLKKIAEIGGKTVNDLMYSSTEEFLLDNLPNDFFHNINGHLVETGKHFICMILLDGYIDHYDLYSTEREELKNVISISHFIQFTEIYSSKILNLELNNLKLNFDYLSTLDEKTIKNSFDEELAYYLIKRKSNTIKMLESAYYNEGFQLKYIDEIKTSNSLDLITLKLNNLNSNYLDIFNKITNNTASYKKDFPQILYIEDLCLEINNLLYKSFNQDDDDSQKLLITPLKEFLIDLEFESIPYIKLYLRELKNDLK